MNDNSTQSAFNRVIEHLGDLPNRSGLPNYRDLQIIAGYTEITDQNRRNATDVYQLLLDLLKVVEIHWVVISGKDDKTCTITYEYHSRPVNHIGPDVISISSFALEKQHYLHVFKNKSLTELNCNPTSFNVPKYKTIIKTNTVLETWGQQQVKNRLNDFEITQDWIDGIFKNKVERIKSVTWEDYFCNQSSYDKLPTTLNDAAGSDFIKTELWELLKKRETNAEVEINNFNNNKIRCAAWVELIMDKKYFVNGHQKRNRKSCAGFAKERYGVNIENALASKSKKDREIHKNQLEKYFK